MNTNPIDTAMIRLAAMFVREREAAGFSAGDRAELRRMDPLGPALPPVFWRVLSAPDLSAGVAALPGGRESAERAMAILVQTILEGGVHGAALPAGKALAKSGYAEQRFVRLLRARGLRDVSAEARAAVRWCANKGERIRFADAGRAPGFGRYILDAALGQPGADSAAHTMARDYFAGPPSTSAPQPAASPQDEPET